MNENGQEATVGDTLWTLANFEWDLYLGACEAIVLSGLVIPSSPFFSGFSSFLCISLTQPSYFLVTVFIATSLLLFRVFDPAASIHTHIYIFDEVILQLQYNLVAPLQCV